jgi:beta-galactosidase
VPDVTTPLQVAKRPYANGLTSGTLLIMTRTPIDRGWTFRAGKNTNTRWGEPAESIVDLPHDFSICRSRDPESRTGPSGGFFPGGTAEYERRITLPESLPRSTVVLEIEGSYMNTTVRCNGQIVGQHPYGYTTFHSDLSSVMRSNENVILVTVNNDAQPNSRWYSGSGLYRHVRLLTSGSVYIPPWGVSVTTPEAMESHALVNAEVTVVNNLGDSCRVTVELILRDMTGREVARLVTRTAIRAGSRDRLTQEMRIAKPQLWSTDTPALYELECLIRRDGEVLDAERTVFGVRSIRVDAKTGFTLNGRTLKLKGGCVHHDCGLLGAAAHDRAEERKVELLKANGFNAVRCAHNPPSPAFLDACDRLGIIVIDEAFDCWREAKNPHDYALYFEDWWRRDLEAMVLRDRNHPSVCVWSTGNEVPERDGRSDGARYSRELAGFVRALDPTRPITNAMNNVTTDPDTVGLPTNVADASDEEDLFAERTAATIEPLDIAGYNYLVDRYQSDGSLFPGRVICGTETFPMSIYDSWKLVEKLPHVIGDFVWTALDYLGEAGLGRVEYASGLRLLGEYPWHLANCGDIDICGHKRPQSYYRDCVWGISSSPYIAVHPPQHYGEEPSVTRWGWPDVVSSWTWPGSEGKPVLIDLYSACEEVELFQDGRSLGRQAAGNKHRHIATFETTYVPGELVAVAHESDGEAGRSVLTTAGVPDSLCLTPDRAELDRGYGDLSFVTVELVDKSGNVVQSADDSVYFETSGCGSLLAVGTADPLSTESYTGSERRLYRGRALVVLRAADGPGQIRLTARTDAANPGVISVDVSAPPRSGSL